MTREEWDFIGSMNMCDEISNEAYKKIMCHCEEQDPCEDCISRTEAIKALEYDLSIEADGGLDKYRTVIKDLLNAIYDTQKKAIEDLPSIQSKPKTGHWIRELIRNEKGGCIGAKMICSKCGNDNKHDEYMNYCPNCGAKMIDPQESEVNNG